MISKLSTLVIIAILLSGCTTTNTHNGSLNYANAPSPKASDELATVYLFHYGRQARYENVTINEKEFFTVRWNTYSWVQLKPGIYDFNIGDIDEIQGPLAKVKLKAGETYYLELLISETYNKNSHDAIFAGAIIGGAIGGVVMALNPMYGENGKSIKLADEKYAMSDIVRAGYIPSEFILK